MAMSPFELILFVFPKSRCFLSLHLIPLQPMMAFYAETSRLLSWKYNNKLSRFAVVYNTQANRFFLLFFQKKICSFKKFAIHHLQFVNIAQWKQHNNEHHGMAYIRQPQQDINTVLQIIAAKKTQLAQCFKQPIWINTKIL